MTIERAMYLLCAEKYIFAFSLNALVQKYTGFGARSVTNLALLYIAAKRVMNDRAHGLLLSAYFSY